MTRRVFLRNAWAWVLGAFLAGPPVTNRIEVEDDELIKICDNLCDLISRLVYEFNARYEAGKVECSMDMYAFLILYGLYLKNFKDDEGRLVIRGAFVDFAKHFVEFWKTTGVAYSGLVGELKRAFDGSIGSNLAKHIAMFAVFVAHNSVNYDDRFISNAKLFAPIYVSEEDQVAFSFDDLSKVSSRVVVFVKLFRWLVSGDRGVLDFCGLLNCHSFTYDEHDTVGAVIAELCEMYGVSGDDNILRNLMSATMEGGGPDDLIKGVSAILMIMFVGLVGYAIRGDYRGAVFNGGNLKVSPIDARALVETMDLARDTGVLDALVEYLEWMYSRVAN